jgi:hypothetical protein
MPAMAFAEDAADDAPDQPAAAVAEETAEEANAVEATVEEQAAEETAEPQETLDAKNAEAAEGGVKSLSYKGGTLYYEPGDTAQDVDLYADGVVFEVVPCFKLTDGSFWYPDTHNGGSWKITNPKPEINAINDLNNITNKNLKRLCRMIRAWKDYCNVPMGGLLIDTFAYRFLKDWKYNDKSYLYYDLMTRDFFKYLSEQNDNQSYWQAVGSNQYIYPKGKFAAKAKTAYNNALNAIKYEEQNNERIANYYWREIYGRKF